MLAQVAALKDKFSFTEDDLTLVLLAVPVVAGVGSVLAGVFAPRLGSALVLRVSGPLVGLTMIAIGWVGTRVGLYFAVAAFGLFLGPLGVALGTAALVGIGVALSVGPLLLRRSEETTPAPVAAPPPRIPWVPILLVGTAAMLMYIADSATSNWGTVYLHDGLHASKSVAPLGLGAYLTCQLLGRAGADRLVRRYGPVRVVAAGGLVGAVGMTLVAVAPQPLLGVLGFGIVGAGLCVVVPQSFSAAGALDPTGSGAAIARVNLFNYVGFVAGAALIGAVAKGASLRWAFAVPAVLALGIVALAPSFGVARRGQAETAALARDIAAR
ncbi:MAG: hypothetical protein AUI10_05790 [Actinobacteria bacterium 13_2_20CM_2_72_6]|nr:MAG: hypothetical protein AUI10_05790 [Actinobacteria bacterium 13_2_20CM_2_72_6]